MPGYQVGFGKRSLEAAPPSAGCGKGRSRRADMEPTGLQSAWPSGRIVDCGNHRQSYVTNYRHGHARLNAKSATYLCWQSMHQRCKGNHPSGHRHYAGRGVSVCRQWADFENFLADMGPRPGPGFSIDRVDNNGNYEPGNCRWTTATEQARNRRTTKLTTRSVTAIRQALSNGARAKALAKAFGVSERTISAIKTNKIWRMENRA